ncbi:DUF3685 domain-containing protein [Leptolyngbya sp. FACHB-261]|uniref:DUF3685 domain-containing protein n=1 Tax=Leptolyngbya sp. FACHB-261 TaxID=2692806 RepID=UPI001683C6C5|nr:DUF3685 domain-containing protein [Leptolyngbya sp. FACHB-261]MBD2105117.1 DUF3685 domain-containing protein [Leptolyngbya sp. FACHB-261]
MTDFSPGETVRLVLIESDAIFLLGLRTLFNQVAGFEVIAETSDLALLPPLGELVADLAILGAGDQAVLTCEELRSRYPDLPILLLSDAPTQPRVRQLVQGQCSKGTDPGRLLRVAQQVARGQTWWDLPLSVSELAPASSQRKGGWLATTVQSWRSGLLTSSSLTQLQAELDRLEAKLRSTNLSVPQRLFLQGRMRELRASRRLIQSILGTLSPAAKPPTLPSSPSTPLVIQPPASLQVATPVSLFERVFLRFQRSNLTNCTGTPLELDILREDKQRELLLTVLGTLENTVRELPANLRLTDLEQKRSRLLLAVWRESTRNFFGRYYSLPRQELNYEVTETLLLSAERVERENLNQIPLVPELLAHLVLRTGFNIDNRAYAYNEPIAQQRAEVLLQNLVLHLACAVIAPLLNQFAHEPEIKREFYGRQLVTTRDIERFRNRLTWRYRLEKYFVEPRNLFESSLPLLVVEPIGIECFKIYSPRDQELNQLSGLGATVTLALETWDAVGPGVRAVITFVGNGVIYVLTILGKGLGLVGKGILQGIGDSLRNSESNSRKNS